jgi:hypothetical protein
LCADPIGFGAAHGRLLLVRVDLDQWRTCADAVARLYEDPGHETVNFGLYARGAERSDRRNELGRLFDRLLLNREELHAGRWRCARAWTSALRRLIAAACRGQDERADDERPNEF